jgi:hypothetical protein
MCRFLSERRIGVLLFGGLLVFVLVAPALAGRLRGSDTKNIEPAIVIESAPTPEIPSLTPEEEAVAIGVASSDSRVQQITAGKIFTTTVSIWHGLSLQKIGGAVQITIDTPGNYELDWPYVDYGPDGLPLHPNQIEHYTALGLTDVTAFVDLARSEVVQLEPGPETIVPRP